ncbi:Dol-P-Glc:Glc(2)Man(9)GlcNAc(2)-PP-Dol alpha-1,2-glucosyltransferase [Cyphellophora attinorum]|uniref:Dol-P-Glc:Glc(2)Man(9)GlcNAc(2)-PP-Dol alpha-1,2-glucosyltransferase n=1 Tax=Cyphellophora attinorum TaxID=1664694 RepID=A0A0N0NNC7_9EURO|nr:Dol-P-Glc:Glc(2)Man(9)GlcNAc(2)-PP-Dol alpha-1,2-glucosyltransferase [Phialophora attinorum]KPI41219.1 Dol-P-Glc:Glc(2)Man(9)GlcNAc(2)-PP-Dol alpha-1,2-glucosyltransferase [Phialophora attinorum]
MAVSDWVSVEVRRAGLLAVVCAGHYTWRQLVNLEVPCPYLDEVFHAPQAQTYWEGKWTEWDPKITTPPALYVFSYGVNAFRAFFYEETTDAFEHNTADLRLVNLILLYVLLVALYAWAAISRREINEQSVLQREFSFICFPLLFFFSGLYYTDVMSTLTVVITYNFWLAGVSAHGWGKVLCKAMHVCFGLVSLATRQTNIFWVAVFLGGLQVIETLNEQVGENEVHDPAISEAYFEGQPIGLAQKTINSDILALDFVTTAISVGHNALRVLPRLIIDLLPQLVLLASFAAFVAWNGGVVLGKNIFSHSSNVKTEHWAGDKSNHIASIHLTQLLYFFALTIFFSWPALLPQLSSFSLGIRSRLPRLSVLAGFTILALIIIHFNTLVHPFTLADNRHYPFYVFRYFVIPFPRKYLLAPMYVLCGWLAITALGPVATTPTARISTTAKPKQKADDESREIIFQRADTVHVSFVLVFLISAALSLITAPLVEPRYFMIPWSIWRLHVPEVLESDAPKQKAIGSAKDPRQPGVFIRGLELVAAQAPSIELLWYMAINIVTGYMFLYRPFAWPQEPGKLQRFMW